MRRTMVLLAAVCWLVLPGLALAQGVLVVVDPNTEARLPRPNLIIWPPHPPHPPRPIPRPVPPPVSYKIESLEVNARLVDQVAQVQVSQTFKNTGSRQMEVSFVFPLPYDGAVEQMTLLVDGKEYPARLLSAEEARRMYEEIVRKNRDPALLEWVGTGLFKTSVFPVPAGASRTVTMRYSQLCRKVQGLTDFLFPLSTAKYTSEAVEQISIRATIESQTPIKNVYSPTHAVEIKRPDKNHAIVTFTAKKQVPTADFRLFFDVGKGKLSTRVLSYRPDHGEDGFLLLLASPDIKAPDAEREKKTVVFVIDRSGSMSGKKIEQVREALKHVLNNLREGDLFNIVAYDSQVESFRPELQKYDEKTRTAALGFVQGIYAGGSTNIDAALGTALGMLQDSKRPNYVVFLTDGLPTAGETNEMKIIDNARGANKVRARIFAFGVGYDVNSRLLDRLVRGNYGQSEYVKPNEDIEDHVARLYNRIEAPVLTDMHLEFDFDELKSEEGKPINRVYPSESFDLFAGEQLVVVGRYRKSGPAKVTMSGSVGGQQQKFSFPAELVGKSKDETNAFIERLWAMRRVGDILDELDLKGKNQELIQELVELARRHGILTPYTSFFADENARPEDLARAADRAATRLGALNLAEGHAGFAQRAFKGGLQRAAQATPAPAAPAAEAADALSGALPALRSMPGAGQAAGRAGGWRLEEEAKRVQGELEAAQQTVRQIGSRTFYFRQGQWVDSQVPDDQQAKARRIKQFSDEYFELVRRHGRRVSQYLVFDQPVLLAVDREVVLIEP